MLESRSLVPTSLSHLPTLDGSPIFGGTLFTYLKDWAAVKPITDLLSWGT